MRWTTLAQVAPGIALLLGCGGAPPQPASTPPEPAATVAPVAVVDDRGAGLAAELARARHQVVQLEGQLREQQRQIETAYAEVERWKLGLDKCVTKLNEVSADTSAISAASYAPPVASGARGGAARVSTLSAPWASVVGDSAVVSVRLWNGGDADASGYVDLELVCGGEVVDSSREPVEISARTDQTVSANLRTSGAESNCSGRARLRF